MQILDDKHEPEKPNWNRAVVILNGYDIPSPIATSMNKMNCKSQYNQISNKYIWETLILRLEELFEFISHFTKVMSEPYAN